MEEDQFRSTVSRERMPFLVGVAGIALVLSLFKILWLTAAAGILAFFVFWFFRDPERSVPEDDRNVLAPGDGRVVSVLEVDEDRLLKERVIRVSIFLNIFNVHVNRIPLSGTIRNIIYQPGQFLMAHVADASLKNEQNAILLENPAGVKIVFVQIAGWVARRIVSWISIGEEVKQGNRFGMIRFGSRVDVYLPLTTRIEVKVGDSVKGGLTTIGVLQ